MVVRDNELVEGQTWNGMEIAPILKAIAYELRLGASENSFPEDLDPEFMKEFDLVYKLRKEIAIIEAAKTVSALERLGLENSEAGELGGFEASQDLADRLSIFNDGLSVFSDEGKGAQDVDGATQTTISTATFMVLAAIYALAFWVAKKMKKVRASPDIHLQTI